MSNDFCKQDYIISIFNEVWMITEINLAFCDGFNGLSNCRFFFVRAGMMGWLLINLSILMKSIQDGTLSQSMILYQLFCAVMSKTWMSVFKLKCIYCVFDMWISAFLFQLYILDYFVHEEYMTSTWVTYVTLEDLGSINFILCYLSC